MKNVHRQYIKRLYAAILGREYTEGHYMWGLNSHILTLVVSFIDSERCGHPVTHTEESWEKKLKGIKETIEKYQELECNPPTIENIKAYSISHIKLEKKMLKDVVDIFPNLWD